LGGGVEGEEGEEVGIDVRGRVRIGGLYWKGSGRGETLSFTAEAGVEEIDDVEGVAGGDEVVAAATWAAADVEEAEGLPEGGVGGNGACSEGVEIVDNR